MVGMAVRMDEQILDSVWNRDDISTSLGGFETRNCDTDYRHGCLKSLRTSVFLRSNSCLCESATRRESIASMSNGTPDPVAGYKQARVLEEGMHNGELDRRESRTAIPREDDADSENEAEDETEEADEAEHPNAKMQWTWTDLMLDEKQA